MPYNYVKKIWKNFPDESTPITAENLNHMENAIEYLSDASNNVEEFIENLHIYGGMEVFGYTATQSDTSNSVLTINENHLYPSNLEALKVSSASNKAIIIMDVFDDLTCSIVKIGNKTYDIIDTDAEYTWSIKKGSYIFAIEEDLFCSMLLANPNSYTKEQIDTIFYTKIEADEVFAPNVFYAENVTLNANNILEFQMTFPREDKMINDDERRGTLIILNAETGILSDEDRPESFKFNGTTYNIYETNRNGTYSRIYGISAGIYIFALYPPTDSHVALGTAHIFFKAPHRSIEELTSAINQIRNTITNLELRIASTLIPKGTVTFNELPNVSDVSVGDMYNVSDSFTTTADFKEGSGIPVALGSNVYKTSDGKWDILAGTPVSSVNGRVGNVVINSTDISNALGYTPSQGTVTSIDTGAGLTGGTITGSGTIKANLVSDTNAAYASNAITNTESRQYAVVPDANGKLSVNVPWTEVTPTGIVQSDWNVKDTASDAYIKNKPANISAFSNDKNYFVTALVTSSRDGLMSATDKKLFDTLPKKNLLFAGLYDITNTSYEVDTGDDESNFVPGQTIEHYGEVIEIQIDIDGVLYNISYDFLNQTVPSDGYETSSEWKILPFAYDENLKNTPFFFIAVKAYFAMESHRVYVGIESRVNRMNFSASSVSNICSTPTSSIPTVYVKNIKARYLGSNQVL